MNRLAAHLRCASYAALGVGLGACAQAWAQAVPVVGDPTAPPSWVLSLVQAGGLPAVVGLVAYALGRGGIAITVRLAPESVEALRQPPKG